MALTKGVIIYPGTTTPILSGNSLPLAIIGTATNATVPNNTIQKVTSAADATAKFGAHAAGDTLPRNLEILIRYGSNNIYAIKVADAASIVGSDTTGARTGIYLIKDIPSLYKDIPNFILAPGQNTDAVVTAAIAVADAIRSIAVIDPTDGDSIANIVTARAGNTGIGQDKERLIITYPYLNNAVTPTIHEPLSTHLAGTMAKNGDYGKTVSSQPLLGISTPSVSLSMSVTDENSDTGKLLGAGVITVMSDDNIPGGYETWGDRNSTFPSSSDVRSFVHAIRTEDAVMQKAIFRARKFIDLPSNLITANMATSSYDAMFFEMATQNGLQRGSAQWDSTNSNIPAGRLKHILQFQPNNMVEIMELAVSIGG